MRLGFGEPVVISDGAILFSLSLFNTSSENIGWLASSASCLTKLVKSLKPTSLLSFTCASCSNLHHLTPEYDGSLAEMDCRICVESSSDIDFMELSQSLAIAFVDLPPISKPFLVIFSDCHRVPKSLVE